MFLKGWKWQRSVAMGTGYQHVVRLSVFKNLRWCGKFAFCGRVNTNHLFVLWRFEQGFGGQWMLPFFPFGRDVFPCSCTHRAGKGSRRGRRRWWVTDEFWSWLASKNFSQIMDCTAIILQKESSIMRWTLPLHPTVWYAVVFSSGESLRGVVEKMSQWCCSWLCGIIKL